VQAETTTEYPISTPRSLWAEQNPADWWEATVTSIRLVMSHEWVTPDEVLAVGLTGQMHGLVLLDTAGRVLRPAILWPDQRPTAQCAEITQTVGQDTWLQVTGNPVLPIFTAPKLLWVRQNQPEIYAKVAHVLLPKDYVRYCLSEEFFSDVSDASGTALFDVGQRQWSAEMLKALDIPASWLPPVSESPLVTSHISHEAANLTGLLEGTPIVSGAGDQAAQAIAAGVVAEGLVSASLGTSGVIFAASNSYRPDEQARLYTFCHALPGMWHTMGVVSAAGESLQWYHHTLGQAAVSQGQDVCALLAQQAAEAPPGSEGLLFLPYLTESRPPHPNPNARGVLFGLTLRHQRPHITRAVLEGVGYAMFDALTLIQGLGLKVDEVRLSGRGAESAVWRQILADIFNTPLVTSSVNQGAAYGAALLAGVGAGVFANVAATQTALPTGERVLPSPATAVYAASYSRYQALYSALQAEFSALVDMG
jgi:xylulokinase